MTMLAVQWRGVLSRSWNYERPLVFAQVVLTKTLGVCRAREIQAWITRQIDIWESGLHEGLIGDSEVEGAVREGRAASGGEEEDEAVAQSYHNMVLSGILSQAVYSETVREGGGGVSSQITNAKILGNRLQRFSGRSNCTCESTPWNIPRAQPSRSMGRYQKQHPSNSRRMM